MRQVVKDGVPTDSCTADLDFDTSDFAPPGCSGVSFLINPRSLLSCPFSVTRGRRRAEASGSHIIRWGTLTRRSSTTHTQPDGCKTKVVRDRVGEDQAFGNLGIAYVCVCARECVPVYAHTCNNRYDHGRLVTIPVSTSITM